MPKNSRVKTDNDLISVSLATPYFRVSHEAIFSYKLAIRKRKIFEGFALNDDTREALARTSKFESRDE